MKMITKIERIFESVFGTVIFAVGLWLIWATFIQPAAYGFYYLPTALIFGLCGAIIAAVGLLLALGK